MSQVFGSQGTGVTGLQINTNSNGPIVVATGPGAPSLALDPVFGQFAQGSLYLDNTNGIMYLKTAFGSSRLELGTWVQK